jgi:hypothetical protein
MSKSTKSTKPSKVSKSFNVYNGITITEKLFKSAFEAGYTTIGFINADVFTKDSKGKELPKMSLDHFVHFAFSERLHTNRKFFKDLGKNFDAVKQVIIECVKKNIGEDGNTNELFTENHVKHFRNSIAYLFGKYNLDITKSFGDYKAMIDGIFFEADMEVYEDYAKFVTGGMEDSECPEEDLVFRKIMKDDIILIITSLCAVVNGRSSEELAEIAKVKAEAKAKKEAAAKKEAEEAEARRKQHIENCINIQRFGAEYQKPLTYDAKPVKRNQHRRMNQKGRPVAEKK